MITFKQSEAFFVCVTDYGCQLFMYFFLLHNFFIRPNFCMMVDDNKTCLLIFLIFFLCKFRGLSAPLRFGSTGPPQPRGSTREDERKRRHAASEMLWFEPAIEAATYTPMLPRGRRRTSARSLTLTPPP